MTTDESGGTEEEAPFKMRDLMAAISEESDLKRSEIREVADRVLTAIGAAVDSGRMVHLPGLGKLTVKRRDERSGGDMLTVKLKRLTSEPEAAENP